MAAGAAGSGAGAAAAAEVEEKVLLVLDYSVDYYELFRKTVIPGTDVRVRVEQCEWKDLHVETMYVPASRAAKGQRSGVRVRCHLAAAENPFPWSTQGKARVVEPDFVLVRNFPTDLHDNSVALQTQLLALAAAGVPAVNSLQSVLLCCQRPLVLGETHRAAERVRERLAAEAGGDEGGGGGGGGVPTIEPVPVLLKPNQVIGTSVGPLFGPEDAPSGAVPKKSDAAHEGGTEAAAAAAAEVAPRPAGEPGKPQEGAVLGMPAPVVVKVGSTHAGYGKLIAADAAAMDDVRGILMQSRTYYTVEPLTPHVYEYRIQYIGGHLRGFRRNSSTSWKNNTGDLTFEEHELSDEDRLWAEEVAKAFGGLDLFAIDVLRTPDGRGVVLEVNDSSMGLWYEHEKDDLQHIKELVLKRMVDLVPSPTA